ncbi:hypothetical protein ABPG72_007614 [Tetrahymena utriculariae]
MIFNYINPMNNDLEQYIKDQYTGYLLFQNKAEKLFITLQFQRFVLQTQGIAKFSKNILFNTTYEDLVQWEGYEMIKYSDGRSNFLVTPEYQLQDYCNIQNTCGKDQTCLSQFNNNFAAQYGTSQISYDILQTKSWSNAFSYQWELLNNDTKQYIIQTTFSGYIYQTFAINLAATGNKVYSSYQMRQSDGTGLMFYLSNRLIGSAINKQKYGGPFNCTKIKGDYNKYKFTDVSQFDGFQYIDQSLNPCLKDNNQTSQCSCPYFNSKRLIPTEWRCRPWYLGGSSSSYIVFNEPQLNLKLNYQTSIITFKIVGNTNEQNPIKNEASMKPDAILGVEIDVNNIQIDKSGTFEEEYLYLVAPKRFNFDQGKGYYQYTAILHPSLIANQKMNITTLEFNNSINRDEEISQYLNKTSFLIQDQLIYEGCRGGVNLLEQTQINFMKNKSEYASIFTPIKVCYGNMYNQQQQIIGYLSSNLKLDIISKQVEKLVKELRLLLMRFVVIIFSVFNFLVIIMFIIFRLMIIYNFEIPIQILSLFINEADSQCIYIFNQMIQNGKLKTQYELKNLIDAISNAVLGIQFRIENYFKFKESDTQFSELLNNLQSGIETFQALQNKQGVGMCLNNISGVLLLQKQYQQALFNMHKAHQIIDQEFQQKMIEIQKLQKLIKTEAIKYLCQDKNHQNFMKILACRKYQLAKIIYKYLQKHDNQDNLQFFQEYYMQKKQIQSFDLVSCNTPKTRKKTLSIFKSTINKIPDKLPEYQEQTFVQNLNEKELFFSYQYAQKFENDVQRKTKTQNQNFLQSIYKSNQSFITQCLELLNDSYLIFANLNKKIKKDGQILATTLELSMLPLILIIQFYENLGNREYLQQQYILQLKLVFRQIQNQFCNGVSSKFYPIIQQMHYLQKAKYFLKREYFYKASLNLLKSLNFNYKHDQKLKSNLYYDPIYSQKSIKHLIDIIKREQIKMNQNQLNRLEQDFEELQYQSLSNYKGELNFFELFFIKNKIENKNFDKIIKKQPLKDYIQFK